MNNLRLFFMAATAIAFWPMSINAQSWTADSNLTNSIGGSYTTTNNSHSLAVSQNRIYLTWYDFYIGPNMGCQIRFKRYDGSTWSSDTTVGLIGNTRLNNWYPCCVTDAAGNFHLVWETNEFTTDIENFEIAYRKYNNNYWTGTTRLTKSSGPSSNPTIAVAGDGRLFVFWQDKRGGLYRIYYKTYAGSADWGPEGILGENADYCGMPGVGICQGLPAVVWEDFSSGTFQVRFRKMSAGGWENDSLISHSPLGAFSPAIAADNSGNIHVVWQDWSLNSSKIYYRKYSALSRNWDQEMILSSTGFRAESPIIICRDSLVDVFWSDDRSGCYEIYRRQSVNGSWGQEEQVTDQRASAALPSVAADSRGNMHLVWSGDQPITNNNPDIFIKSLLVDPWPPKKENITDIDIKPLCSITTYPNPTLGHSILKYSITPSVNTLTRQSLISYSGRLDIFNVAGQLVTRLFAGNLSIGEHYSEWNGRDGTGRKVASGIYFAKVTTGTVTSMAKIMVVR